MTTLPMFPLGSVLFPSMVLPLHVFEPRYRALVHDVLAGSPESGGPEFGVCLIERGPEVGGDDVRLDVGTVAAVQEAVELPDGRWAIVAVGTRRVQVDRWLPDDPYPRADVVDHPDPAPDPAQLSLLPEVTRLLHDALAKAALLGEAPPGPVELSDDPVLASHQIATLAPVSTLDQYALLVAPTIGLRLASLLDLLTDAHEVLDLRLRGQGPGAGET